MIYVRGNTHPYMCAGNTKLGETHITVTPDPITIKRRSSLSIESAASRKVSSSCSEGPGLEAGPPVGSRALRLGRKWVHYLGIILNSSVQGLLAIGMAI